ncbi:hypothetical protein ACJ73_08187 [Blastomyces percursus]|uniref:Uncharacterized protein n=1 Tax=Blastomyces percursus TaxID=1658174 RepID=A0A1J9PVT1_9EURO|nr:hypothetical protein ACJ73_08187 [Blastomyces percursus]
MECDLFAFYPCGDELELTFKRSHRTWSSIFQLKGEHNRLYARGRAIWHIESASNTCDTGDATSTEQLLLGVSAPTKFTVDGCFSWLQSPPGSSELVRGQSHDNHLAAFTCAWAFILSAFWAESHHGSLKYTGITARIVNSYENPKEAGLMVIQRSASEAEWWASILANGNGWRATVQHDGKEYLSPWNVQLCSEDLFTILTPYVTERITILPPSATEALSFLSYYCATYDIRQQGIAALFAALALPTHSLFARPAALPRPCHIAQQRHNTSSDTVFAGLLPRIPSFMTISAVGIAPILRSALYDPETYCHVSGAWLSRLLAEWPPEGERAAISGYARSPTVGGLWMGTSISSLVSRKFIHTLAGSGMWRANLPLSWWTGTPQSFFCRFAEGQDSRMASVGPLIPRAEEAFLLFITSARGPERHLIPTPLSPWSPPGESKLNLSSFAVQRHAACGGHRLRYKSWSWEGLEGMVDDRGFSDTGLYGNTIAYEKYPDGSIHVPISRSESPLNSANNDFHSWVHPTRAIFQWLKETRGPEADQCDVNTDELLQVFEEDSDVAGSTGYEEEDMSGVITENSVPSVNYITHSS